MKRFAVQPKPVIGIWIFLAALVAGNAMAQPSQVDLTELSLESLMDIQITSVSKKEVSMSEAPAAVFVITNEDIRRSGVTSVPEALRLAPGLHVARISNHDWAITARGGNGLFANKLLVLIDGRTVYTPLFSGVFWGAQDVVLEDIDRIEVIRGPGASVWGSNAVNGVINIITKSAKDTNGWLITAGAGDEERGFGTVRHGTKISEDSNLRLYTKYFNRDNSELADGSGDAHDSSEAAQGGFRFDKQNALDRITVQGDIYSGNEEQQALIALTEPPYSDIEATQSDYSGGNILANWRHTLSDSSETALQLYYDRTNRRDLIHESHFDTYDVDFQYSNAIDKFNELQLGLNYRFVEDSTGSDAIAEFIPKDRTFNYFSGFIQNEFILADGDLHVTVGSKFEHNDLTGFEVQPTGRVAYLLSRTQTVWGAISRALSTPSRANNDLSIELGASPNPDGSVSLLQLTGNRSYEPEEVLAYELGYRIQPEENLNFDLAAFYNDYNRLTSVEPGLGATALADTLPLNAIPLTLENKAQSANYGAELVATWKPREYWTLQAWYTYLRVDFDLSSDSQDIFSTNDTDDPEHQARFRSLLSLSQDVEFDTSLRYVDDIGSFSIDSYVELDLRLGWKPTENVELSLAGLNLLHDGHEEYESNFVRIVPTGVERSIYGKVTLRF